MTIVFADLVGSTALQERLDAESVRRFMDRYYAAMRGAVEAEHGTVTQLLGDGVKAVFGAPRVAEDDAIRAVRAAVAMQTAFRELAESQQGLVGQTGLRVAVNTGEVVASDDVEIIGDPVNVAARLQEEAGDGDVVLGEATRRIVGELVTLATLGSFAVKGRAEPVSAWRVVSLARPAGVSTTPFVGREAELRRLLAVQADSVAARRARLAVVLGSPGLGKSRLLGEVARHLADEALVLSARCDPAGGASFAPLAAALRIDLGLGDAVADEVVRKTLEGRLRGEAEERTRVASGVAALLGGSPAPPEETFFAVRRYLTALASARPVVLALDDLQWAEPLLLDLVEHLAQWTADAPLFVLGAARPELREARSSLAMPGGLVSEVVMLAGLDAGAAMRLAASVVGAEELPAAVAGRVLTTSEGNPLFVGELVRMLVQDGAIKKEGGRWTAGSELAQLEMPPTIQALLAARLERLRPEERTLLERAAVVGPRFSRAALRELLPPELGDLDRLLEALRRSELVEPDPGWFLGEPALRFHHALIRDAAYRRVLKEKRAELHERFADWVAARVGEAIEHDETLGWHLEQAHRHLAELGPVDARGRALGERAAKTLGAAGRRALARDDVPLAAGLLGRALERLDPDDPARADLALDWCEALLAAGEVATAARAIDELGRFAEGSARLAAWHTCFAGERAALVDPQALRATAESVAAAAAELATLEDVAGEAKAHFVHAMALQRLGQVGACEAALDRALAAARCADDRRRSNAVLAGAPQAALWGPSPVTRASGRCLDVVRVLRITQGAPTVEAVALRCQGVLEALRGRSEAARRMIATSREMVEELGITQGLLETEFFAGLIDLIEGDAAAAEPRLRAAYAGLRDHGLGIDAARAAAFLGLSLLRLDRAAEAEALSHESEALAGDDLQAAITWRRVRAEALARRGEHVSGIAFARAAVDIAAATDALIHHADARRALAAALRTAGRAAEADAEDARAVELWEAKGATLLAERLRDGVGPGASKPSAPEPASAARPRLRRVRQNAATAQAERVAAAFEARDLDALAALIADDSQLLEHPNGNTLDREGALRSFRVLMAAREPGWRQEPLATLGDTLALFRWSRWGSGGAGAGLDVGPFAMEEVVVTEVDAAGRHWRGDMYSAERLGDAVARLYERHAELAPDGHERACAAAAVRTITANPRVLGPERFLATLAPDVEFVDRRTIGFFGTVQGAEAFGAVVASLHDASPDTTDRYDDVLALRPDGLLVRIANSGTDRTSGGAFERQLLRLSVFEPRGVTRVEQFDADREAEALTRFDALLARAASPQGARGRVRPNAMTALAQRLSAEVAARDFDAIALEHSEDVRVVDHTLGLEMDHRETLDWWRLFFDEDAAGTFQLEPLATLGDSLALFQRTWAGSASAGAYLDVGPFEHRVLDLLEGDARRAERVETFGADHLGDAIARLYERYAELLPEGPERERAAGTARSVAACFGPIRLEAFAAACAANLESVDHRTLGFPPGRSVAEFLRILGTLVEASPDAVVRFDDILGLRPNAQLSRVTNVGTDLRSGGAYERLFLCLFAFGTDGLIARMEFFDSDREAEALARFDALTAAPRAAPRIETTATRAMERFAAALAARDGPTIEAGFAPGYRHFDRRRLFQFELDRGGFLAWIRTAIEMESSRFAFELRATRGDRLSLHRFAMELAGGDFGPSEFETWVVSEVDEHGQRLAGVRFDLEDGDAAWAELAARYAAGEAAAHPAVWSAASRLGQALRGLDWEAQASVLAPDLVFDDHRVLGWGTLRSRDEFLTMARSRYELRPDSSFRTDHIALCERGWLHVGSFVGSEADGVYETPTFAVCSVGADGRIARMDTYDPERDDLARARFEELARPDPLRVPPNAVWSVSERVWGCIRSRDWDALRTSCGSIAYEDRRRLFRVSGDFDTFLANAKLLADAELDLSRTLLATSGDRLALSHFLWAGRSDGSPFEVEHHNVEESDAEGRLVASILFDPDDRRAAFEEMEARFLAGEAAAVGGQAPVVAFGRALVRRDWEALRDTLAAEAVIEDHRTPSLLGTLDRERWVESARALVELAPDVDQETLRILAWDAHGRVDLFRMFGTRAGGSFENLLLRVIAARGEHIVRLEMLDPADTGRALARFAELSRPDLLRVPPNAATRAMEGFRAAFSARDLEGVERCLAPGFAYDDRRRGLRDAGDREKMLASVRLVASTGTRVSLETLSTSGDRRALQRCLFTVPGGHAGDAEIEILQLAEVDDLGRLVATVVFDPDDRRAASLEVLERTAPQLPRSVYEFVRGVAERDLARCRAALPDDFVCDDHCRTGLGRIEGADAYLASVAALFEQTREVMFGALYTLERADHGLLAVARRFGKLADGGEFESVYLQIVHVEAGRFRRVEFFELEDLERARARFEALGGPAAGSALRVAT